MKAAVFREINQPMEIEEVQVSRPGPREVLVRTQWNEQSRRVRLVVQDSGAGFPEHILKRAFEPYVTTKPKGTGLGLAVVKKIADEHGFTIRQLYQWIATARGHCTVVGSAEQVADQLEEWFLSEAADGFNILPPWLPGALDDFVDLVVPILQRRGLFRTAYEGRTLRENLGLPRPANPWTLARATVQAAE